MFRGLSQVMSWVSDLTDYVEMGLVRLHSHARVARGDKVHHLPSMCSHVGQHPNDSGGSGDQPHSCVEEIDRHCVALRGAVVVGPISDVRGADLGILA